MITVIGRLIQARVAVRRWQWAGGILYIMPVYYPIPVILGQTYASHGSLFSFLSYLCLQGTNIAEHNKQSTNQQAAFLPLLSGRPKEAADWLI